MDMGAVWVAAVAVLGAAGVWVFVRWVKPSETYRLKWAWRFSLRFEISSDNLRSGHIKRVLLRQRWLFVLGAAVLSALLLEWIVSWLTQGASLRETLAKALFPDSAHHTVSPAMASAGAWSVLSAVLIAPLAFVLWWFRDTNQLWLIENNRKDTNLKDFQKLCEWAVGLHLVEDEVSTKTSAGTEEIKPVETTVKHSQAVMGVGSPPSRREGSEALQVAAVHQLKGYLVGEFGQQFERPALVLLLALWQRLTQHLSQEPEGLAGKQGEELREVYDEWRAEVQNKLSNSPLGKALQLTLLADKGLALRKHAPMLPSSWLFGMNTHLPGLQGLRLNHQYLNGINLKLSNLREAKLQGADLSGVQLQGANLRWAQLQGADLSEARLQGADLSGAQLQGADLIRAQLQGADLSEARLQGAGLSRARLQGADLSRAQLQGADLIWARLQGASLSEAQVQGASLTEAQLQGADLSRSQLQGADLRWAELQGAVLRGAQLQGANLRWARLQGVRLNIFMVDDKTVFENSKADDQTNVEISNYTKDTLPVPTHALRLKLRDVNGLNLVAWAYEEFKLEWSDITEEERQQIYAKAYDYSADPEAFEKDFPHLV